MDKAERIVTEWAQLDRALHEIDGAFTKAVDVANELDLPTNILAVYAGEAVGLNRARKIVEHARATLEA